MERIWDKKYILKEHQHIAEVFRQAEGTGLHPQFNPTVTGELLVYFMPGLGAPESYEKQEEEINHIVDWMQATYIGSIIPYVFDEAKAEQIQKSLIGKLRKVEPDLDLLVFDIEGRRCAGTQAKGFGVDHVASAMPCYQRGAGPVQATVLEPGDIAIYAARLPAERGSEMYALAKANFPQLLQPMIKAVASLEETR